MKKFTSLLLVLFLFSALVLPCSASTDELYIYDSVGLLEAEELIELNDMAAQISHAHGCGVYVIIVEDYRAYGTGYDVFETTWRLYHANNMGYGADRQGMVLLLSMAERDYATFFYGADVEYAFDAYGQEKIEEYFLDNLADNDWYGGFRDYLDTADEFLSKAAAGDPVRESAAGIAGVFVLAALVISGIATLVLWKSMNNVSLQRGAAGYAAPEGLQLTRRSDNFLHVTRTRRKIQTSSSSGSRSHSGGGGSGRSGKF